MNEVPARALILAAGLGTRLRPLTNHTPKCLVPIGDRPLLDYWVDALRAAGVREALINTHHLAQPVREYVERIKERGLLECRTFHEPVLLGSAGTIAHNPEFVSDGHACLVIYADNLSNVDLRAALEFHAAHSDPFTMVLFRTANPRACGIAQLDEADRIVEFVEKPEQPKGNLANAGIYVITAQAYAEIAAMGAFDLGFDVLPRFVGRMRGFLHTGYHLDIGNMEALERARTDVAQVFGGRASSQA
jgi:mannose-1-phosphate guanylyltransferase